MTLAVLEGRLTKVQAAPVYGVASKIVALSERIAAREDEIVDALSKEAKLITRKMAE